MRSDQPGGGAATRDAEQLPRLRPLADDGDLVRACRHRFGHGQGPAGETWVPGGETCGRSDGRVGRLPVACGPGQRRVGQQGAGEGRMAGRLGVVRGTARSGEELFGIVCGVEETALAIGEMGQRRVQ